MKFRSRRRRPAASRRCVRASLLTLIGAVTLAACGSAVNSLTVRSPHSVQGASSDSPQASPSPRSGPASATASPAVLKFPGRGYCQRSIAYYGTKLAPPQSLNGAQSTFAMHSGQDAIAAHVSQEAATTAREPSVRRDAVEAIASDPGGTPGAFGVGVNPRAVWVVEESGLREYGSGPAGASRPVQTHAATLVDARTLAVIFIQLCL